MATGKSSKISKCQLLLCNCEQTMKLDAGRLRNAFGLEEVPKIHGNLCRAQLGEFEKALALDDKQMMVACTQEAPLFREMATGNDRHNLSFVNIRETAGWSNSGGKAEAKIAALIAAELIDPQPAGLLPVISGGNCIIFGKGQEALEVAQKLSGRLGVTLLLSDATDVFAPSATNFPIHCGKISSASGSMGKFNLIVDQFGSLKPSSRDQLLFQPGGDGVELSADLIFDLSGDSPLFSAQHGRDGYVSVQPGNKAQIAQAMLEISDLVGEFEKPLYVSYNATICAHSRSNQVGCSNCIDNCPTSAIFSAGEHVEVDPGICDGCGHCSSSCPTGAISYTYPNRSDLIARCQTMLSTYRGAGGKNAILLLHEDEHGGNLISAMARYGDGLAENVLPLGVQSVAHIGHEVLCAFFTCGVQSVVILAPDKKHDVQDTLEFQISLANLFLREMQFEYSMQIELLTEDNPDVVAGALAQIPVLKTPEPNNFIASANKRETARLALASLNTMAPVSIENIELPVGSPYGIIAVDPEKCTLCLACVGACPMGALADNPDCPQVSITENSCVQCGLCRVTCPENAISLQPRYNFDKSALSAVVLHREIPMDCVNCGKPFGSKSSIEKVIGMLAGKNPMFETSEQLDMLKMCEDCRVEAMAGITDDPMAVGTVPKVLTADDVLEEDEEPTLH